MLFVIAARVADIVITAVPVSCAIVVFRVSINSDDIIVVAAVVAVVIAVVLFLLLPFGLLLLFLLFQILLSQNTIKQK